MKGLFPLLILATAWSAPLSAALPAEASASVLTKPSKTKALISGLEAGCFEELPPVIVQLTDLCEKAAVWVEVSRGDDAANRRGRTVESRFFLRKGGAGVLSVPGIQKACRSEGTWTLRVLMSNSRGTRVLSAATFVLQSEVYARRGKAPSSPPDRS